MKQRRHQFVTVVTAAKALHDLIADCEPDRVVVEICSIACWVSDLVRRLGFELQVANTTDQRWQWRRVKEKNDLGDALKLAQLSAVKSIVAGACAGEGDALMAGCDYVLATPGAAAHEDQEPHARAVAARRATAAARTECLDGSRHPGFGSAGQTLQRSNGDRLIVGKRAARFGHLAQRHVQRFDRVSRVNELMPPLGKSKYCRRS